MGHIDLIRPMAKFINEEGKYDIKMINSLYGCPAQLKFNETKQPTVCQLTSKTCRYGEVVHQIPDHCPLKTGTVTLELKRERTIR